MKSGNARRLAPVKAAHSAKIQEGLGPRETLARLVPARASDNLNLPRFFSVEEAVRALRPAEPLYCMHPDLIDRNAGLFLRHFPGRTFYAVKGNPDPYLLRRLYAAGVRSFDVASIAEIKLLRGLFADATLAFMHPVKGREAIREAYFHQGVRIFVCDTMDEMRKIREETDDARDLTLFVRLAMPKGSATVSMSDKFGASVEDSTLLLQEAKKTAARVGLSFHVGHQTIDPHSYEKALERVRAVLDRVGFDLDILDVGGGFPSAGLGDDVPPLLTFFDTVRQGLSRLRLPRGCEVWGEPGRSINADASTLIVRVELRKGDALYINDGSYGSLFDMCWMGMKNDVRLISADARKAASGAPLRAFHLYGPTCATEDHIKGPFMLPADIAEGDWIAFDRMGGYAYVMQTGFNGFRTDSKVEIVPGTSAKLLSLRSARRGGKGGV